MPTEAGKTAARELVRQKMAGETYQAFATRAKVDPQTLGDFLAGRRWPIGATLAKIETALELTPGTLAVTGEDPEPPFMRPASADRAIGQLGEEDLLAELTYRVRQLKHEIDRLREPAEEMLQLRARRETYLQRHADDDEEMRSVSHGITSLVSKSEHEGLNADDESDWSRLWDRVHLRMLQSEIIRPDDLATRRKPLPTLQSKAARPRHNDPNSD